MQYLSRMAGRAVLMVAAGLFLHSAPVWAKDPPPFPEFTFKMGKPPKPGTRKRIDVRITPEEFAAQTPSPRPAQSAAEADAGTAQAAVPDVATARGKYGWFWDGVPTGVSEETLLRFETALLRLSKPPAGEVAPQFRLQHLQKLAAAYGPQILVSTLGKEVSPALVLAVIAVESGGRADAVSSAGAQGVMQLIPDTAARFGVKDSLDAGENIRGGVAYLDWLLTEFKGDPILALAGYNAGENAVKSHKGVPPYAETLDYVPKVLAAFEVARGLCKTRPQFVTDGCALTLASAQ
ncbi:lytic transglycosylase domain-containing protein [Roseovarius nubinhibens]|uniref:lytic transglycosylase domain-containing protein n=1 Tax=Roseovarius nubinhibens TaxID=314263 RepID=UPI001FE2F8A4|nr:lytic transglycosylase domain-containing protein [Roseovarius nubinhibens]